MDKVKPEEWPRKVDEYYQTGEDWNFKRQIMINWNYFVGNQWIGWDRSSKRVIEAPRENNEERVTYNVIKQRVMTKLSKQTKNRIKYDVMPDTNSQERIEIAKAATKFVKFWWQEEEMDRKTRDIFLNNSVKKMCAAKVYFDPDQGDDITPEEDEPGYQDGESVHVGKIICRICDPLTLYIDPAATSDDEIRWIVEEKPRDVDYIKDKYGVEVTPDDNVSYITQYDLNSTSMMGDNQQQKRNKNMAMLRELWVRPCSKYPKGLKVTCTKTQMIDIDEKAGDLPYIIFGDIPVPGTVKYSAFIEDMLPVQREINIIRTMFATHAKRMGNTIWSIPIGTDVDEEMLTNEEGGLLYYTPLNGARPQREEAPNIPNFYDRIIEYGKQDIDDMSGAREIAQGRLPAGLDTASGLSLMVEQENEKLAVSSQNYEQGMKKLLTRVLELMKRHYTEERLGRILGADNEIELVTFTGSDLSGGEDINIVQGSSLPEMKSAQQDRIMGLWKMGAIVKKDGTPDVDAFLRLMGMGDSTELFEQNQLDENNAKMENKQFDKMAEDPQIQQQIQAMMQQGMQQGQQPQQQGQPQMPDLVPIWDSDDHEIHIYQHNIFRKSSDYRQMPQELRMIVDHHVQQHMDIVQQHQQTMAQSAASANAKQPIETIMFKDLPTDGKIQLAQQAGIQLSPQSFANDAVTPQNQIEMAKVQAEQQKNAVQMHHQMQMKAMDHQNNLDKTALQGQLSMQQSQMSNAGQE